MTKNVQTMQKLNQKCFYKKKHVNTQLTRIQYRRLASIFKNPPPAPQTLPSP